MQMSVKTKKYSWTRKHTVIYYCCHGQIFALQWVHFNCCVGRSMVGMPFKFFLVPCVYCSIGKSTYCSKG